MKFKAMILAAVSLVSFSGFNTHACSCGSSGDTFMKSVLYGLDYSITHNKPFTPTVIAGRVVSYNSNSMNVEVLILIDGQETRKNITVWGDDGMQCRPYVKTFPIGSTWIFNLSREYDYNTEPPTPKADYEISICGTYWLSFDTAKNEVKGPALVNDENATLRVGEFIQAYQKEVQDFKTKKEALQKRLAKRNLKCELEVSNIWSTVKLDKTQMTTTMEKTEFPKILAKITNPGDFEICKTPECQKRLQDLSFIGEVRYESTADYPLIISTGYNNGMFMGSRDTQFFDVSIKKGTRWIVSSSFKFKFDTDEESIDTRMKCEIK